MGAFIGSGRIKVAPYASGAQFGDRAFVDVGNTSAFSFAFTENRQELRDFRDPSGGVDASVARIESVTGSMDLRHFTASNLALALWGTTAALAATAITNEAHKARLGRFVPLNRIVNTAVAVVVRVGATVVNAADYAVSHGGLTFVAAPQTAQLIEGADVTVDYTPVASTDVQTLIGSAPNVSVLFEGVNGVDGKPTTARMYRCKLGVAANVGMIGEEFGTLQLTFTVEKDATVPGVGKSHFFELQQAV